MARLASLRRRRFRRGSCPWDLISGSLDYYDRPDRSNRLAIQNVRDPDATTLLAAHVEYWKNPLVFQTIVRSLF